MTALITREPDLSRLLVAYTGWRLIDGDKRAQREVLRGKSLSQIERQIATAGNYGSTILILAHEAVTDTQMLHVYRIRRGKWAGGFDTTGSKYYPHTADKLFAMPVAAFEPAEAWQWSPGCDVVGLGSVIEGARA